MSFADPAEVRQMIKANCAEPAGFIGFPALVLPKGPLSALTIRISARRAGKPVNAPEALILYHRDGKMIKEDLVPGPLITFDSKESFDPKPIGFYMLTQEPAEEIMVEVSGPSAVAKQRWKI